MRGTHHSKSGGSLCRVCTGLLLIFATIISGWSTSGCATQQTRVRRPIQTTAANREISIIPQPNSITLNKGYFEFSRDTKIIAADGPAVKAATSLNSILMERYRFKLGVTAAPGAQNSITFSAAGGDAQQSPEGYSLKIEPSAIQIRGSEPGMFYGIQSLVQLLPADFSGEAQIPAADILDAPRFRYRGMHLDVSRHFMPVEFVKKYIRLISRYKYNYFHWHLTDDQGWRIEVKKYPELTAIGSTRRETVVDKNYPQVVNPPNNYAGYIGDRTPVEGYYTQEQIRNVVAYANARYVTIVPEIDLPGHSSAALASRRELGCRKNYPYKVQTTWGAFKDIFCPTKETFEFIEDVLTEVIDLFPDSPYIHIGGDEVRTDQWKTSEFVQDLKRANGLSSEKEVVSWFIKRVASFVDSKGKTIIGWDEIVDGGLPPKATVMAWRPRVRYRAEYAGKSAFIAAKAKHEVIMSPFEFTYFDHSQAQGEQEPLSTYRDSIVLQDVYKFEPVPAGLGQEDAKYIIGGEGCLWTEFMKGPSDVEYMMFPRAIALAEVLWSKEHKNFAGFQKRLFKELPNLCREHVKYWEASPSCWLQPTTQGFQPNLPKPVRPVTGQPQVPAKMPCPEFYHPAYVIVGGRSVLNCVPDF